MSEFNLIKQQELEFHGNSITAVLVDENGRERVYIVLKSLVESLGISWQGQLQRIKRDSVLSKVSTRVNVLFTRDGGAVKNNTRQMIAIPLRYLEGFLFGINDKYVKPEYQQLLHVYRDTMYQKMHDSFNTTELMEAFYTALGHSQDWVLMRIESYKNEVDLSRQWLQHDVPLEKHDDLKNVIMVGTFGLSKEEYLTLKGLEKEDDLQDHMSRMELVFDVMGRELTRGEIAEESPLGFEENKEIASKAGKATGDTRLFFEQRTGKKIVSPKNNFDMLPKPPQQLDE